MYAYTIPQLYFNTWYYYFILLYVMFNIKQLSNSLHFKLPLRNLIILGENN